ncbi:hypothetical protein [Flavobacterium sp. ABG]|uniref:hypothetical protein n=1 Tax=Flavobacterium sp. ABG TaxID=1423322 RepID=UPI000649E63B|nr:hypothetical protein [Flavobacterium sp. ABG]KLT68717.1 hypothetical protein AB674_15905 [Flavobacterium sp. ABG]
MKLERTIIECKDYDRATKRKTPFHIAKYTFNYQSDAADKALLDKIIAEGTVLANKVNPGAANNGSQKREYEKILNNCIAGILSEYLWKHFLNSKSDTPVVRETKYEGASTQIDLEVIANNKKIEVRSSFPRNGIVFSLCSSTDEFDVIGMYSNSYKPAEIQKNYYVRALFHLALERYWQKDANTRIPIVEKLLVKMKTDGFEAFLTGGATWEMMINDNIGKAKNFIPHDEKSIGRLNTATSYRVVPFSKALDTKKIFDMITSEK